MPFETQMFQIFYAEELIDLGVANCHTTTVFSEFQLHFCRTYRGVKHLWLLLLYAGAAGELPTP